MSRSYSETSEEESHAALPGRFYNFSAWLRDHVIVASLIIFFCAAAPRLYLTWLADPKDLTFGDSPTYLVPARSMIELGSFLNNEKKPEVTRTPGYPAFLAALMYVVGRDLGNIALAQAVVLSLSVLVLYWLARRILPPVMAFTGALLAAGSPWGAVHAGLLLTEGLYLFMLASIFFAIYLVEETTKRSSAMFSGAFVGLLTSVAVMVRPIWPLVLLVAVALFLRYGPRRKGVWLLVMVMVVCAVTPLYLWKVRNANEAQFNGLTDISGHAAWLWLASRVKSQVNGADRFSIAKAATLDQSKWGLEIQEVNDENWRRARAVFREHPFLTIYSFALSAGEVIVHPSPYILTPAGLRFYGDYLVLGLVWGGLLILAGIGLCCTPDKEWDYGEIDRGWLLMLLVICALLTLSSGIAFGGGARYRVPLELIVPLLAGVGLIRAVRSFKRIQNSSSHKSPSSTGHEG